MDPLLEKYEAVGRREIPPPVDYNLYKRLLAHARRFEKSDDLDARLLAVDVCGAIGGHRGMYVVRDFLKDADVAVRRRCVEAAVADGETGLPVLRAALDDADEGVVLEALSWLRKAADRGSAGALRRLVRHPSATVRAAAAELVGHVAGPGMTAALRPLLTDDDEAVRTSAAEAVRRLDGELPQATPELWWGNEHDAEYAAPEPIPLPDPLPEALDELMRTLARVAESDRKAVLDAMTAAYSPSQMGMLIRKTAPDEDRPLSVGAAITGRALGRADWVVALRRLLPDEDPWVRIAVCDTLGDIGGASVVMGVKNLLVAPQPAVRASAVRALHKLCDPRERDRYLAELGDEASPQVLDALADIRGESTSEADPAGGEPA